METINRICEYLHVQPSEIMEWIPDVEYNKANEEKQAIEAQIAELQAKLKQMWGSKMPFVEINVKNEIEKQRQNNPEFKKAWDESRAEYKLIGEMISLRKQENITQKE